MQLPDFLCTFQSQMGTFSNSEAQTSLLQMLVDMARAASGTARESLSLQLDCRRVAGDRSGPRHCVQQLRELACRRATRGAAAPQDAGTAQQGRCGQGDGL